MRTDPRIACANEHELWGWATLHDLIAHPLMALTRYSKAALRFHDWTSHKAWPRVGAQVETLIASRHFGALRVREVSPGVYAVQHSRVDHTFVTQAGDAVAAVELAEAWFQVLANEFGGPFERKG